MDNNKIIRRYGILKTNIYDSFSEDMCELFGEFEGTVCRSIEPETQQEEPYTLITFGTDGRMYLKIEKSSQYGVRVSIHLGDGTVSGRDLFYLDSAGISSGSLGAYSFARSPYGAVISVISYGDSAVDTISDANLRLFFSKFTDEEGGEHYGFVYCNQVGDDTATSMSVIMATTMHPYIETITGSKLFLGTLANHNVLCNAFSYTQPLVSSRLYKKLQTEGSVFGKVKIGGKTLIAGGYYALECVQE